MNWEKHTRPPEAAPQNLLEGTLKRLPETRVPLAPRHQKLTTVGLIHREHDRKHGI